MLHPGMLPEAVQAIFNMAGVLPLLVPGLNAPAWLSSQAFSYGRPLLIVDADISPEGLEEVADWVLSETAERLAQSA